MSNSSKKMKSSNRMMKANRMMNYKKILRSSTKQRGYRIWILEVP